MAAKIMAFSACFDAAYVVRHQLKELLRTHVPLHIYTNSQRLFDIMVTEKRTKEVRLLIDVHAARQAYRRREIENIGLIASDCNPADALTKLNGNSALESLIRTHTLSHPIRNFVVSRDRAPLAHP
jgi:hypothetical protein